MLKIYAFMLLTRVLVMDAQIYLFWDPVEPYVSEPYIHVTNTDNQHLHYISEEE